MQALCPYVQSLRVCNALSDMIHISGQTGTLESSFSKRGTTIRILIVDDSEAILNFMSHAFDSSPGMEVIGSASNGAEAVAIAEGLRPDVVIMDVQMPIMDGLEATRRIKQAHPAIIVVLVSGSAGFLSTTGGAAADGYLMKPFSADSLICEVFETFEKKTHVE